MTRAARIRGRIDGDAPVARDPGVSYIEVLVSVVLLGTAIVAILAAVRATVIASRIDSEQADAQAWAQSGADAIDAATRIPCAVPHGGDPNDASDWDPPNTAAVLTAYETALSSVPSPSGLPGSTIRIATINFLGRSSVDEPLHWSSDHCFEGVQVIGGSIKDFRQASMPTQRITIEVRGPEGELLATRDVVKGEL